MGIFTPIAEKQIRAIMADETEAGYQRVSRIDSDLSFIPLNVSGFGTSVNGTAGASSQYFAEGNPFGTLDAVLVTVPVGTIASPKQCTLSWQFYGRRLSICWERYRSSNPQPIGVMVNAESFSLDNTMRDMSSGALGGNSFQNSIPIPFTAENDGPHQCKLVFPMDLVGAVQRQWLVYGYEVERRFANFDYKECYISRYFATGVATATYIGRLGANGFPYRSVCFSNTSGFPAVLTRTRDLITLPPVNIANNAEYTWDFGKDLKLGRQNTATAGQITVATDVSIDAWAEQRTR